MAVSRTRRIVRRAVMALAVSVLLLACYVSAWIVFPRSGTNPPLQQKVRPAFAPLIGYCDAEMPGSALLIDLWWLVNPPVWMETRNSAYEVRMVIMRPALSPRPPEGLNPTLNDGLQTPILPDSRW